MTANFAYLLAISKEYTRYADHTWSVDVNSEDITDVGKKHYSTLEKIYTRNINMTPPSSAVESFYVLLMHL